MQHAEMPATEEPVPGPSSASDFVKKTTHIQATCGSEYFGVNHLIICPRNIQFKTAKSLEWHCFYIYNLLYKKEVDS